MQTKVTAVEARQKLGELLNRVTLLHEEIIIERAGKPLARLSPVQKRGKPDCHKLDFRKAAGLGADSWKEIDAMEYVRQERDEWG
ncbi:MAG: type II toxin-antitoxin system prevent-host-death family antitoxin [Pseudomonadota bacterium]|nr:type II toxin-antitoxin system prevent-host-death family antitoxin [Pseudomonadota bacterium]